MILVTQSFGKESEYRRAVLAVLSFYACTSKPHVTTLLFTDRPEWFIPYFQGLPVEYILLTQEKIKQMRGEIDFLHRMKIALIEESFQKYDTDIFYTDSDTFFLQDPMLLMQQLSAENSFMHLREYEFETLRNMPLPAGASFQAFVQLIESKDFSMPSGPIQVTTKMSSWNAGVMMLHRSHAALLPDVYALTDQFYPVTHNHASEQYAFSIVLQSRTRLAPCEELVYHYWYGIRKKIIDELLAKEFKKPGATGSLTERLTLIAALTAALPGIFEKHLYTLKDNAIQDFNRNEFLKGYRWSMKAIFSGGIKDSIFIKDILYHFKRQLTGK